MDDLFGDVPQPERQTNSEVREPLTSSDIRVKMLELIAALRSAEKIPFPPPELERHIAMFPIMAQWLPDDEADQLRFEFDQEIERLKKAA